jgi:Response regulator of the LytR/AlgR family
VKIKLDISPDYSEKEIVIKANANDAEVQEIVNRLKDVDSKINHLDGYLDEAVYSLETKDILFFETNDRNVYAHTSDKAS